MFYMPSVTEITKIVSAEWNQLDDFKKQQFKISDELQHQMRSKNEMNDINALRNAVL